MADQAGTPVKAPLPAPPPPSSAVKRPSDGEDSAAKRFKYVSISIGLGRTKLTPDRPDYSEVITVLIGKSEKKFIVHKATICSKSPFFAAACSGKWAEGQEGIVRLPGQQSRVFAMFLHWVYTQTIDMTIVNIDLEKGPSYLALLQLWATAHYLQAFDLCNKVVDTMFMRHRQFPTFRPNEDTFQFACNNTTEESGARRLLLDLWVFGCSSEYFEQEGPRLPSEITLAIAKKMIAGEQKSDCNPVKKARCYYHNHSEGDAKCI